MEEAGNIDAEIEQSEQLLFEACENGNAARFPARRHGKIRYETIFKLLVTDERPVHNSGIQIENAELIEPRDFGYATFVRPLSLLNCRIPQGLKMRGVTAPSIDLSGSRVGNGEGVALDLSESRILGSLRLGNVRVFGNANADRSRISGLVNCRGASFRVKQSDESGVALSFNGAHVDGDILLSDGFKSVGQVDLNGIRIGEQLSCSGDTEFEAVHGRALTLYGADVGHDVFLEDGFRATGEVHIGAAALSGSLHCAGARLENPSGSCLILNGTSISNDLHLSNGFEGRGMIDLLDTRVEGSLILDRGTFEAGTASSTAILAQRLRVGAAVWMRDGFNSRGVVDLSRCQVAGSVYGGPARFSARTGPALDVAGPALDVGGASIGGDLRLDACVRIYGYFNLANTHVDGQLICDGARITSPKGTPKSVSAEKSTFGSGVSLAAGFATNGAMNFAGSVVGGDFNCTKSRLAPRHSYAVDLSTATVSGDVLMREGFVARGQVGLISAHVSGSLRCDGGRFSGSSAGINAITAIGARIDGGVSLDWTPDNDPDGRNRFVAAGGTNFTGAKIGGQFICTGGRFENQHGRALTLERTTIGSSVYMRYPFEATSQVYMLSADIGGQLDLTGGRFASTHHEPSSPAPHPLPDAALVVAKSAIEADVLLSEHDAEGFATPTTSFADHDSVIFDDTKIGGRLFWRRANWPGPGKLEVNGLVYEDIDVSSSSEYMSAAVAGEWLGRIDPERGSIQQPYNLMAAVFRRNGDERAASEILIARERLLRATLGRTDIHYYTSLFFDLFDGYGYRPFRVLRMAIIWLFFAAAVVTFLDSRDPIGSEDPAFALVEEADNPATVARFNPALYAIDSFIQVIDLGQDSVYAPTDDTTRLLRTVHQVIGWILWPLTAAAVSGLRKRFRA